MTKRQTQGFSVPSLRCAAAAAGGVALFQLACMSAPHAPAPAANEVPTVIAASAAATEPDAPPPEVLADSTSPSKFEAAQRSARSLFGKGIGPEFDADDPTSLAPEGYSAEVQLALDFDANGQEDVVVLLKPDPDGTPGKSGPCVIVLALAVDASKYMVAAINVEAFACPRPLAEDGIGGTEVMFTTSANRRTLGILVTERGPIISETWYFRVRYEAESSKFVLFRLFKSTYNRVSAFGGNATLHPLEGRGERVKDSETGTDREPLRATPTRVFFEDLSREVAYKLLGS